MSLERRWRRDNGTAGRLRVCWFIHATPAMASARLQGYLVHDSLLRHGVDSRLLLAPPFQVWDTPWEECEHQRICDAVGNDIAIFQKLSGPRTNGLVRMLRAAGAKTAYVHCDYDPQNETPLLCDAIVCPSEELADFYRKKGRPDVSCIPDPAESFADPSHVKNRHVKDTDLSVCWIGNSENWYTLAPVRRVLAEPEFADVHLVTVSNHPDANVPWSLAAVRHVTSECDLGVVPAGTGPEAAVKSSNRVVLFMAAGVPVIAGRVRSYEELIVNGSDGFIVGDREALRAALRALRDPIKRTDLALRAYAKAQADYTVDAIGRKWVACLEHVNAPSSVPGMDQRSSSRQKNALCRALAVNGKLHHGLEFVCMGRYNPAFAHLVRTFPMLVASPSSYRTAARSVYRMCRVIGGKVKRYLMSTARRLGSTVVDVWT